MKLAGITLLSLLGSAIALPTIPSSSSSIATPSCSASVTPTPSAHIEDWLEESEHDFDKRQASSSAAPAPFGDIKNWFEDNIDLGKRHWFPVTPASSSATPSPSSSSLPGASVTPLLLHGKRQAVVTPSSSATPCSSATPSATPFY
ncbi:hypothetical protein PHISP_04199 [Aspergillus sp. HF37]|nr:hypothetical protein PHISP_04199 [Aspergillus sp. HF37]